MVGFSLNAHVCGQPRSATATFDGLRYTVSLASGDVHARSLEQAIRIARDEIGRFLVSASRGDRPWGLTVSVGSVSASYGDPHPGAVPQLSGPRADPNSLVARIRSRWRDGDSPRSAVENAIEIIRAYSRHLRQGAA
jgi:hypothetical protein